MRINEDGSFTIFKEEVDKHFDFIEIEMDANKLLERIELLKKFVKENPDKTKEIKEEIDRFEKDMEDINSYIIKVK